MIIIISAINSTLPNFLKEKEKIASSVDSPYCKQLNHSAVTLIALQPIVLHTGWLRRQIQQLRHFQAAFCHSFRIYAYMLSLFTIVFLVSTSPFIRFYSRNIFWEPCFFFLSPTSDSTSENNDGNWLWSSTYMISCDWLYRADGEHWWIPLSLFLI